MTRHIQTISLLLLVIVLSGACSDNANNEYNDSRGTDRDMNNFIQDMDEDMSLDGGSAMQPRDMDEITDLDMIEHDLDAAEELDAEDMSHDKGQMCEVTCDLLDITTSSSTLTTQYESSTQTVIVGLAPGAPNVSKAFLDASIPAPMTGGGGGIGTGGGSDLPTIQGTVEADQLRFDLSSAPADVDEVELTNLDIELECDARKALMFTATITLAEDAQASSFECTNPFF